MTMLMPTLLRNDFFDDFFCGFPEMRPARPGHRGPHDGPDHKGRGPAGLMKTDVKETEEAYDIAMDLPGFKKEDVRAQVKDGYLVIEAQNKSENEEKDEEGKFLRRERFVGSCRRTFYVGEDVTEEDVTAKFEDGVLSLTVPKKDKSEVEEPKYIAIEG